MPAPSRIRDTPITKKNTLGFGVSASRRIADSNRLKRSITKPRPIRAKLLRCHARSVRSAANNTRGSGGLDMMKHPGLPMDRAAAPPRWRGALILSDSRARIPVTAVGVSGGGCSHRLDQHTQWGDVLEQLRRKPVSRLKVYGCVVRQPDPALRVLPGEHLERQIDRERRRCGHQRRASLWATQDQQFGRSQAQAGTAGVCAEVDASEYREAAFLRQRLEPIECLGNWAVCG